MTNEAENDDSGGRLGSLHGQKIGEFLRSPCKEKILGNPIDFDERRSGGRGGGCLKRLLGGVGKRWKTGGRGGGFFDEDPGGVGKRRNASVSSGGRGGGSSEKGRVGAGGR